MSKTLSMVHYFHFSTWVTPTIPYSAKQQSHFIQKYACIISGREMIRRIREKYISANVIEDKYNQHQLTSFFNEVELFREKKMVRKW